MDNKYTNFRSLYLPLAENCQANWENEKKVCLST